MKFNLPKIKGIMSEKNMTQEELANFIGMDKSTLNAKLNGCRKLYIDEFCKIINVLNFPVERITDFFIN